MQLSTLSLITLSDDNFTHDPEDTLVPTISHTYSQEQFVELYDKILRSIITDSFIATCKSSNTVIPLSEITLKLLTDKILLARQPYCKTSIILHPYIHVIHLLLKLFEYMYECENFKIHFKYEYYHDRFIQPNIYLILTKYFTKLSSFINTVIRQEFTKFKRNSEDTVKAYFTIFTSNRRMVYHDIMYTFIFQTIYDIDPLTIQDIKCFIPDIIRTLMYQYFRKQLEGMIDHNITNMMISDITHDDIKTETDRTNIYKHAFDIYITRQMCNMSDTAKCIDRNLSSIKVAIVDNIFHDMIYSYMDIDKPKNQKANIITLHGLLNNVNFIKDKYPQVFKFLQCVRIESKNKNMSNSIYTMLETGVYEILYAKFYNVFDSRFLVEVLKQMSGNLVKTIAYSKYIDPVSLKVIFIDKIIANQLLKFLEFMIRVDINHEQP